MKRNEVDMDRKEEAQDMDQSLSTRVADVGFWREMWRQLRLVWHLIRSPDVPIYLKLLPLVAVLYVLVPTDLIPDVFPFVGQLDDLTALLVGAKVFIELAPQDVVARHLRTFREDTVSGRPAENGEPVSAASLEDSIIIDGDFQIVDDEK